MLYKKIVIFLLLSQPSCTLFYASEEQNNIKSQNKESSEEQSRTIISWNGINYLFINNLYYFSTRKYTFGNARFSNFVYIKYRRKSATPSYLEKEYSFFARIQEFLYNLFSFSLYFFKKSFFYKIDILGNDVFFYPMTADYTTNIIAFILGTTACKISLQDYIKLECRLGIGLSWRRLSYSYAVSYKCKSCEPDKIKTDYVADIDNKLFYDIKYTGEALGIGVLVVKEEDVRYQDAACKYTLKFSILENLKESYTWEHFDIVINCSFLLRSKVTFCLNLNFGILEAWQVYKCYNVKYEYSNENILTFSIPFVLRHFSLNISYLS